ncbi:hypothetical protein FDI36_gp052 [Streptomyces phage NootNoot]|uniref:Uncharacterized protein n=3 Tax=Samistivirus TaxID=2560220 RepID=A0A222YYA4_9CAUD|nr:hypothetical protein FDI36_gp002 [Streptomyces phage NootNoot]YP_009610977.1 hypothetical protein FDI36_gp052 [Streptomyces phage NootNoot]YP_010103895.1 hypothetical protein KNU71_gp002 [Streptomyces phage Braelyn]YP_010104101.1 hypothetical protein KNU71_gp055 [Streptomyces phage Braelyn]UGL63003.1 hypothetical protein SEA_BARTHOLOMUNE_2 [Streptomyces phage Bartholomune]UOW93435.1 hypothetical protein SEA_SQUILLIUM_2 [Streptomyces phage Squillium]WNM73267.1 hypothetical protein SEA_LIAND
MAMVMAFGPEENEDCEGCFARRAIGTFNLNDVETPLCGHCSVYRNADNTEVIIPNEPV